MSSAKIVEVTVRHVADLEEVLVSISETATIREFKEILAQQVERPELVEVGEILRINVDGSTAPFKETQRIGNMRKLFGFKGCPLHPPAPERPPLSLDDFAEFDPDEEVIGSPRSVRACTLEGAAPEDLVYVPLESYQAAHIEPRISDLWYDFFEAIRQDVLRATRATRQLLIAEEEGRVGALLHNANETRIAGTGGNWCGVLDQSQYTKVHQFFRERNEMCNIDRIYKGATKPFRPNLKSAFFTDTGSFQDDDPVLAGDSSNDAARKLQSLLQYYNSIPNARKRVEEQRLKTRANGIVQYAEDTKKLHRDQSDTRRLLDHRIETAETQINIRDYEILENNAKRKETERVLHEATLAAKPHLKEPVCVGDSVTVYNMETVEDGDLSLNGRCGKVVNEDGSDDDEVEVRLPLPRGFETKVILRENLMHTELHRQLAIKTRNEFFAHKRGQIHDGQLDAEYARCDKMKELALRDQAVQERVHQHRNLKKLAFAREWTKRRVRWQLKNNSIVSNRKERSEAILNKHKAAADRVDTQHLIRQKTIEYKRELKTLMRVHADHAAKREKARQDARRDALGSELSRMSREEADPSPSPLRRSKALHQSLGSTGFETAPISNLLKQPRVVKRTARFDFPRVGSGMMSSSPTASTFSMSGTLSMPSTMRQSMSMPSFSSSQHASER